MVAVLAAVQSAELPSAPRVPPVPLPEAQASLRSLRDRLAPFDSDRSGAITDAWIAAALLAGAALAAAALLLRGRREPEAARGGAPAPTHADGRASADRDVLVAACMRACDGLASGALRDDVVRALAAAGVSAVDVPSHTRFDPTQHRAADTLGTEHAQLAGLVAETERLGFVDRGRRLRWPEVVVYRLDSRSTHGA